MSDVILNFSLLNSVDPDPGKAMDKVLAEIFEITRHFLEFLGECLLIIADQYIGLSSEKVGVGDPPFLDDLVLPYFVRPSDKKGESTEA